MQLPDRIKKIRLKFKLSQLDFSNSLGVSRGHISNIETGAAIPSEQLLKLICATWAIDENWLRTGKGQMRTGELTKQEEKEHNEMLKDVAYDDYLHKMESAADYLKFIKQGLLEIEERLEIEGVEIDRSNLKHHLLGIYLGSIQRAYLDLVETMINILNKDEKLIDRVPRVYLVENDEEPEEPSVED